MANSHLRARRLLFDLGPSLLTLPHVFDEVFRVAGTSLDAELDLVRLDPQFAYHWADGSRLVVHDDNDATAAAFEAFVGSGERWREFDERGRTIWEVSERTFFAGPMSNPSELAEADGLVRPHGDRLDAHARRLGTLDLRRPPVRQWAGRYATYSRVVAVRGSGDARLHPAHRGRFGCWYPIGAARCTARRVRACGHAEAGVEIHIGVDVARIVTAADGVVSGVELGDGSVEDADIVVANTDAQHLYADLLPDAKALRRVRRAKRSTSGFVLCVGVRGLTPRLEHHNVWFSESYRAEYDQLDAGDLADDPTIYALRVVGDRRRARHPTGARTGSCWSTRRPMSRSTPTPTAISCSTGSPTAAWIFARGSSSVTR